MKTAKSRYEIKLLFLKIKLTVF